MPRRHSLYLVVFFALSLFLSCQAGEPPVAETGEEAMADMEGMESQHGRCAQSNTKDAIAANTQRP